MTPQAAIAGPVADRFRAISQRIVTACERVGRDPHEVTLVGVTKTVDVDRIREALDAGLSHLGENRVQEAIPKMRALSDRAPTWHLIGHLQTNKARKAAELFDCIESLDSLKLAEALEACTEEIGRDLRAFAQVNVGGEASKHGVSLEELPAFVEEADRLPSLTVVGLMAIPPQRAQPEEARADFRRLAEAFRALRKVHPEIEHLSMGMSSDFEVAIEEGATEVRVGRALFGERPA